MSEKLKGLDDVFVAGYTPEDLIRHAIAADIYLESPEDGGFEGFEGFEGAGWRPPISLEGPPLPEFPVEDLPEGIREYADALARFTQSPKILAGGVALGSLATACAKKVVIEARPGWEEPPQLWTLTLLESGNRKSAVMEGMAEPLDRWEREKARELEPCIAEAESRRKILEERKRRAEKDAVQKSGEEASRAENEALETARVLAQLEVPSPPQLIASDVTPEEAGRLCHQNDGRIALWSDEGEIFKIAAGRYSGNQAPNAETFLNGHAGGNIRVNRVGRSPVNVPKGAVTMVLVVQPEVLASLGNRDTLRGLVFSPVTCMGRPRAS